MHENALGELFFGSGNELFYTEGSFLGIKKRFVFCTEFFPTQIVVHY
jgi:hypothetical protein